MWFFCALSDKTSQQCSLYTSRTSFTPFTFSIFVIPASFFGSSLCSICSVHMCFRSYAMIRSSTMHPLRDPGPPTCTHKQRKWFIRQWFIMSSQAQALHGTVEIGVETPKNIPQKNSHDFSNKLVYRRERILVLFLLLLLLQHSWGGWHRECPNSNPTEPCKQTETDIFLETNIMAQVT